VVDGKGGLVGRVGEVLVELPHHDGAQHALVDDGAGGVGVWVGGLGSGMISGG